MSQTASARGAGRAATDLRPAGETRVRTTPGTGRATPLRPLMVAVAMLVAGLAGCSSTVADLPAASSSPEAGSSPEASSSPVSCPNPEGGECLGALQAGTYTTRVFRPTVTYTVPDGWINAEDLPGNFQLYRQGDDQSGALGGSYIGIYQDGHAASQECREVSQPDVGTSPEEMVAWVTSLPTITASTPAQVSIGGLEGLSTDLIADGTQPCTFQEGFDPATPILIGSGVSGLHHVVAEGLTMRLIVLDWQDKNVTIEITSIDEDIPAADYHGIVEPIIRSLDFEDR